MCGNDTQSINFLGHCPIPEIQNIMSPWTLLFSNTFHPVPISTLQTWVILLWFQVPVLNIRKRGLKGQCEERQRGTGIFLNAQHNALWNPNPVFIKYFELMSSTQIKNTENKNRVEGKVQIKMEQKCHFKLLAPTQHGTIFYDKEQVKQILVELVFSTTPQKLWILQLCKKEGEIPASTVPNPQTMKEFLLHTQQQISEGTEAQAGFSVLTLKSSC